MKVPLYPFVYPVNGNSFIEYDKPVVYPINAVIAKTLEKNEKAKVVLLATKGGAGMSTTNIEEFKKELNTINKDIGANIAYESVEVPFDLNSDVYDELLSKLIDTIKNEKHAQIIADITYGIKPLLMILFCALNFAEKFFNATVENIVYGKVEFKNANKPPENPMLYDITQIYYLNKMIGSMESPTAETAVTTLNDFFTL
ncbi:MAG: hypothetical protein LBU51_03270 [Bacteroidales bacterium]|jgi:hypothetical protein|nr:hypothetical protein [Bacteroidales bacterium]